HQLARELQRLARFEDVVDQKHVAPGRLVVDVAQDPDLAGGGARAVAGDEDELDLRRQAGVVHRPDQVRGEDEGALQDRDDQNVVIFAARYVLGELEVAPGDGRGAEQHFYLLAAYDRHQRV